MKSFASFAEINFEKEAGVIEKNSKLLPPDFVNYQTDAKPVDEQNAEWKPQAAPQFGKITLLGGFSDYKLSTVLTSGSVTILEK